MRDRCSVRAYISAVVVAAVAATIGVAVMADGPVVPRERIALLIFFVLLVIGELRSLQWLKLHDGGEITPSWAFAFSILLLPAPLLAVLAMATASTIGDLVRRKPLERVVFNLSQTALSLAVAAIVLIACGQVDALGEGEPLGVAWFATVVVAACTAFAVNALLTCVVLSLHEGTKVIAMMRRGMVLNLLTDGALVSLAPVFVVVAQRSALFLPLVAGVAAIMYVNTRAAMTSEHEANHDVLTRLWNRRAFLSRIEREFSDRSHRRRSALVLIDLDGFKEINDRLGHEVGDMVLRELGGRLASAQEPGRVIARMGGDEFAVLITKVSSVADVTDWAERLRGELGRPCVSAGFPVSVTGSFGVALWPDHGSDADVLFRAADLAMYGAKKAGNGVAVSQASAVGAGRMALLAELEQAIANGELTLWYQPQVELASGRVVAFEALARWTHPRLGLVMPDEFMPLAEHTELMGPITERVLDIAVRDSLRWHLAFPSVRVAVNTSARNLRDLGFAVAVGRTLQAHRAPRGLLELEITENTVLIQPDRTHAVLQALEGLGITLSIDDFGTGYSSLSSLRRLPVRAIKIDKSFVGDIVHDADGSMIVKTMIELAHNLGLKTVAEGVEAPEAVELLAAYGCDVVQGYLIGMPMPIDEVLTWLGGDGGDGGRLPRAPERV